MQLIKTVKTLGLKKFIKHALYVRHEESVIGGVFNEMKKLSDKETLQLQTIRKEQQNDLFEYYKQSNIDGQFPRSRIERYFANGCKCIIALKDNRFIGHMWWCDNKINFKNSDPVLRYMGETFTLKDEDSLAVDFFIIPEERGGGTVFEFLFRVYMKLSKLGYTSCTGMVRQHNKAARWTYILMGHVEYKKIVVHRIFNYLVLINKKLYFSPHSLSV